MYTKYFCLLSSTVLCACVGNVGEEPSSSRFAYDDEQISPSGFPKWKAIGDEESSALRANFSWDDTEPLPETEAVGDGEHSSLKNLDSRPALHYVQIFVESPHHLGELEAMQIHFDVSPLFEEEWPDGPFTQDFEGDQAGGNWVFAMMPAVTYNLIREEALAGSPLYSAIQLRTVPDVAKTSSGTISYEFLGQNGIEYAPAFAHSSVGDAILFSQVGTQKRFGRRLRMAVNKIRDAVRAVVDTVRMAIGQINRLVQNEITLEVRAAPTNRDPGFMGVAPPRTWHLAIGPSRGPALKLTETRVNVSQLGGISLFRRRTNDDGIATVKVPEGKSRTRVCVEADSTAAAMETSLFWPIRSCSGRFRANEANRIQTMSLDSDEFYALALIQDARVFADKALNYKPRKAFIQTGRVANALTAASGGRAFVPCLQAGGAPVASDLWAEALNSITGSVPGTPGLGDFVEFAMTVDIILPPADLNNRGTPVHEYGHFYFCDLMRDERPSTYSVAWSDVMRDSFAQSPDSDATVINEGVADWFASQVAGGVNYFTTGPVQTGQISGSFDLQNQNFYFHNVAAGLLGGMEDNIGGERCTTSLNWPRCQTSDPFVVSSESEDNDRHKLVNKIARVATTLHDFVDGHLVCRSTGNGPICPRKLNNNAAPWQGSPGSLYLNPSTEEQTYYEDEMVALGGGDVTASIRHWARNYSRLTMKNFMKSFATIAIDDGHTRAEVCGLFGVHEKSGRCDESWLPEPVADVF